MVLLQKQSPGIMHMQFMNSSDFSIAKGIPFVIDSYKIKKSKKWVSINNSVPKKEEEIRFEENQDRVCKKRNRIIDEVLDEKSVTAGFIVR
jgi:hypothetical protein